MSHDSPPQTAEPVRPLVIFADDFGRHPSNSQHLARRLAVRRPILWVNTIGTRRPRLRLADLRRAAGKLSQWTAVALRSLTGRAAGADDPRNIHVINPIMWPDFASPAARRFNALSIGRAVNRAARRRFGSHSPEPVVLTTLPLTADLVGRIRAHRWLYYAVDDYTAWPGLDHATLTAMESDLLDRVDAAAAVGDTLAQRLASRGFDPPLIDHGIDIDEWHHPRAAPPTHPILDSLRSLPSPLALYWGLIDDRLDHGAITRMASEHGLTVALIGPVQGDLPRRLDRVPGVHLLGAIDRSLLPHAASLADLLIAPYIDSAVTRAMQPLKLKEYLATDRPVVATELPATRPWSDCCDVAAGYVLAYRAAEAAFLGADPRQLAARRDRLAGESWAHKAALLEEWIDSVDARASDTLDRETGDTRDHEPETPQRDAELARAA